MTHRRIVGLALLSLLLVGFASGVAAELYRWADDSGQVHFTDNYGLVPPEFRDRVQSRPSSPPSEPPALAPMPSAPRTVVRLKPSSRRMPRSGERARVIAVIDGDTVVISGGEKVRYLGINTPETHHPDKLPEYCGQEAFEANRRLVAGKTVRLEFDQQLRDKYGRLLAYVYVDNLFVNAELVRQGYAQVSTYRENQRHHEEFQRLQQSAIEARRGLWGGCVDSRVPPPAAEPRTGAAQRDR
jgi:micrococcal nuclease